MCCSGVERCQANWYSLLLQHLSPTGRLWPIAAARVMGWEMRRALEIQQQASGPVVKAVRRGPNPWSNNLDTPAIVKSGARAAASLLLPRCVNIRAAAAAARPPPPPLLLLLLLLLLLRPPCRSRCGARRGRRPLGRSHRRDGERCRDGGARILQIMRQVLPAARKHKVPGGRGPLRELVRATAPRCCMRGAALRRSEAAPPCCAAASPSLPRLPPPAAPAPTQ